MVLDLFDNKVGMVICIHVGIMFGYRLFVLCLCVIVRCMDLCIMVRADFGTDSDTVFAYGLR